ncbi:transcriptional regulator, HxlR family [Singulisphaera sp. GP187]|uniref:winged helix-turn-helix transcriptional regulator n=1 Tax=Singulisphaera sp. GP187 TaxID=1882752 RepID=UPI00092C3627|nr:helix-turn-helix domain-containing protein [Singulisphaera sp. GP187]SIN94285.1 transcriptional regulator, HxlR family [Singulisphaera sp. GP187]
MPHRNLIVLDEECAQRRILELFSVKWTTMVLHSLHQNGGTCRTGVLARSLPGCSKKMLTQTLREMERDGLIDRKVYPVVPPMVEYSLNSLGKRFIEPLELLYAWASQNSEALQKLTKRRKKRTSTADAEEGPS